MVVLPLNLYTLPLNRRLEERGRRRRGDAGWSWVGRDGRREGRWWSVVGTLLGVVVVQRSWIKIRHHR